MTKRFIGVLIFAFVVASLASLLLYRFLSSTRPQTAKAAPATIKLAIAARNLEVGTILKESDVKLEDWSGSPPDGAFSHIQDVIGRGVTTNMLAKEPILESRLAGKGAGGGLASMIPEGMRAVAVRVNDVAGVAGFVTPGMRVDVLISGSPGNQTAQTAALGMQAKTMLQNVEVLSAGQDYKKDAEGKPQLVQVVNLLATPEQAEMLSLASTQTNIQLVLRNPLDRQTAKTPGTAVSLLFKGGNLQAQATDSEPKFVTGAPATTVTSAPKRPRRETATASVERTPLAAPPQPAKPEPPFTMQIISGTRKQEVTFQNQNAGPKNNGGEPKPQPPGDAKLDGNGEVK